MTTFFKDNSTDESKEIFFIMYIEKEGFYVSFVLHGVEEKPNIIYSTNLFLLDSNQEKKLEIENFFIKTFKEKDLNSLPSWVIDEVIRKTTWTVCDYTSDSDDIYYDEGECESDSGDYCNLEMGLGILK
jgi:hypothetical protein